MFLTQREERDRHLLSIRFDGFKPVIPRALTAGQKLTTILTTLTTSANYHAAGDFDRLPIPFKCISTDIVSGHEVVLDSGSLADAMRATMGFPLAFTPLDKGDALLMDGGMVTPIPVDLVRAMSDSVDFVVAVNTVSPLLAKEDLSTPVDIANQVTSIMTADKLAVQLESADYAIAPPLDGFTMSDFGVKDSLIAIGYRAGLTATDSIIAMLRQRRDSAVWRIDSLRVDSCLDPYNSRFNESLAGRTFSRGQLIAELKSLFLELNLFRLEARLGPVGDSTTETRSVAIAISGLPAPMWSEVDIEFAGNLMFGDSTLRNLLRGEDTAMTSSSLRRGLGRMLGRYRSEGFDLADLERVSIEECGARLLIVLDEARITEIEISGNRRTKDWMITSNFPLEVGEPYSTHQASRGLSNIYGRDLFDRVTIDVAPCPEGARLKIGVEEKHSMQLRIGWHWDDEYQSEEFAELLDDNVMGAGLQYLLHARYADERQEYFGAFKADRIFSTYLTAKLRLYHNRLDRNVYDSDGHVVDERDEDRTGFEVRMGQQISRLGTVSAGLALEEVHYAFPRYADSSMSFSLRAFKIESLVENFDRIPFPESGKKHLFEIQFTGKGFGGEVEYTKFYSSLEAYWMVWRWLNYHPKLAVGLSRSGLPVSEKFYLGGLHSFAGFRTDQLSGDKVIAMSHEFRIKLPLRLYLSLRYDIGDVYGGADNIKLNDLRHGFGVTAAFDSPIGPFEFGYGVATDGFERYYLNIGLAF
jgi:NTE family protein